MDWVGIVVSVASPFAAPLLDPRRISPRSELGKALKRTGRRGRNEVTKALRDGRAVSDPHLASLAAALAEEQMRRSDYRGPPRRQEVLTLILGAAALAPLAALRHQEPGVLPVFVCGYSLLVVWVVGLRRLVPTHRHTTDRLLTAYRANAALGEQAGPGELERVRFGTP
jgi:Flp pilus assembly protein TadB